MEPLIFSGNTGKPHFSMIFVRIKHQVQINCQKAKIRNRYFNFGYQFDTEINIRTIMIHVFEDTTDSKNPLTIYRHVFAYTGNGYFNFGYRFYPDKTFVNFDPLSLKIGRTV
ncbi:hypothetical protein MAR_019353 [Mya arenaria]|uniref:Uncharacterized protein n=1 Tax=Mya arenaria TaxID=6604 RepID=A0ABY7EHC0_MYAAR|nr:hypothetical protein MAR_019353 [Mya arenaria]